MFKSNNLDGAMSPTQHMNNDVWYSLIESNTESGRTLLPFLPNKNGYCNVTPAKTVDGYEFTGIQQLMAKIHLHKMGHDNERICTFNDALKHDTFIKRGEKGFYLPRYDKKEGKVGVVKYFSANQVGDKDKLPYVDVDSSKTEQKDKEPFVQATSNPAEYIGNYLMCVHQNRPFTAPAEVANKFKQELAAEIRKDPLSLFKICNQAQKRIYEQDVAEGKIKAAELQKPGQEKEPKKAQKQVEREGVER